MNYGDENNNYRHGHCSYGRKFSPTYNSWRGMIERCTKPQNKRWKDYGGRGIKVCDRWLKFENFLEDMGERPEGTTLDREDNNKGYYKENCRWATDKVQRRNSLRIVRCYSGPNGEKSVAEWSAITGTPRTTIQWRLNHGREPKVAVFGGAI